MIIPIISINQSINQSIKQSINIFRVNMNVCKITQVIANNDSGNMSLLSERKEDSKTMVFRSFSRLSRFDPP